MAYLDFSEAGFAASARAMAPAATVPAAPERAGHFSALEWLVIALAERDRLSSLRRPGRFTRIFSALFGGSDAQPLARPRLEALRRLAVLAWHRGRDVPAAELAAFQLAGFSAEQAGALFDSVAVRRERGDA